MSSSFDAQQILNQIVRINVAHLYRQDISSKERLSEIKLAEQHLRIAQQSLTQIEKQIKARWDGRSSYEAQKENQELAPFQAIRELIDTLGVSLNELEHAATFNKPVPPAPRFGTFLTTNPIGQWVIIDQEDWLKWAARLIQEKKYQDARKILVKLNHPKARQWLIKLDEITPKNVLKRINWNRAFYNFLVVILSFVLFVAIMVWLKYNAFESKDNTSLISVPQPTLTQSAATITKTPPRVFTLIPPTATPSPLPTFDISGIRSRLLVSIAAQIDSVFCYELTIEGGAFNKYSVSLECNLESGHAEQDAADELYKLIAPEFSAVAFGFSVVIHNTMTSIQYSRQYPDEQWVTEFIGAGFIGTPRPMPTPIPTARSNSSSSASCPSSCSAMTSCGQAYACLPSDPGLDGDKDGVPCESLCSGG